MDADSRSTRILFRLTDAVETKKSRSMVAASIEQALKFLRPNRDKDRLWNRLGELDAMELHPVRRSVLAVTGSLYLNGHDRSRLSENIGNSGSPLSLYNLVDGKEVIRWTHGQEILCCCRQARDAAQTLRGYAFCHFISATRRRLCKITNKHEKCTVARWAIPNNDA